MARGEVREKAILAAVMELLGEVGYERMTTDAVAARAHASKTTMYKRWPGKPELVRAAVDSYVVGRLAAVADTGSLRGDLMALMEALRGHLTSEFLAMMAGLVNAMREDPALAAALWSHLAVGHAAALPIISRAAGRGELPVGARHGTGRPRARGDRGAPVPADGRRRHAQSRIHQARGRRPGDPRPHRIPRIPEGNASCH
jgi:AcrR family transcriptional regulator